MSEWINILTARIPQSEWRKPAYLDGYDHSKSKPDHQNQIDRIAASAMKLKHAEMIEAYVGEGTAVIIQCMNDRLAIWRNPKNPYDQQIVDTLDKECYITKGKHLILID